MRWIALALALLASPAAAQVNQQSLCANCVVGRLGIGPGPTQAIPFATLSAQLTGASITLNSGNGQTAPGLMTGGGTYSFGATTDTPRMTGLGLGGVAPATGLKLYNAAVLPGAGGQSAVGADSTNGGVLLGQGSLYDASIQNKSGAIALAVPTGTQNIVLGGTLTAASLATVGTVGGSICATSAGLILYESGVNCFAVSGVVIASGKTLTVNNTLTFNGTDGTTFTFPGATDTVDTLGANQTVTGNKTFSGTLNITGTGQINGTAFGTFATANSATPPAIGGTTPAAGSFTTLTASTPVGLSSGGTNASTAAGARASAGLNIDEFTAHGDSAYNIQSTDRVVGTSATFTASRTWTLPAASTVNPGQQLIVADYAGGVSGVNTLVVQRGGSDTVNGSTSITISTSNSAYAFFSDGISKWTAQALGAAATVGVSSVNGQTGSVNVVAGTATSVSTAGGNVTVDLLAARKTLPTTQAFSSGTSLTYTTPANALWIEVFMRAGGGGGGGSGTGSQTAGGTGGTTTFNSVNAVGGSAGAAAPTGTSSGGNAGGTGGTGGTGSATRRLNGNDGSPGNGGVAASFNGTGGSGGPGGDIGSGGAGKGGASSTAGNAGSCGGGGGGAGGGSGGQGSAGGGGSGEWVYLLINSPAASYTYTVGTAGTAGSAGTSGFAGGAGGAGCIFVLEHYGS